MSETQRTTLAGCAIAFAVVVVVALIGALGFVGCGAINNYHRSQARKNATNGVAITAINIKRARQHADIVKANDATVRAQAQQRVIAARGIAQSQQIINRTITPLYVELEAVDAQRAIATSGRNNTVIYVPSGTNGTPVITQRADGRK